MKRKHCKSRLAPNKLLPKIWEFEWMGTNDGAISPSNVAWCKMSLFLNNLNMLNWSKLNLNHPIHQHYISTNKITCIQLSRKNAKKSRTVSILSPKALRVSPSNHYVLTMCNQYFMIPSTRSYVGNASFWRGSYFFKSSTRSTANPPCLMCLPFTPW